jgi:hypothetical protein
MIFLRQGQLEAAFQIFEDGVKNNPWFSCREYFQTALAIAWIRRKDFVKAIGTLQSITSPSLAAPAEVLRLHSFGSLGRKDHATTAYRNLQAKPKLQAAPVTTELYRRYILNEEPRYSDEWLVDQEVEIFLTAA